MGAQFRRVEREREINHPPTHAIHLQSQRPSPRLQLRASGMNLCYGAITFQQKLRDSRSSRRGVIHLNYHTASKRKTLQIKQNVALMGLEIH